MRAIPPIEALSGTDQWHAARRGCLTASRMADAMAYLKSGAPAKARTDLMIELVAERMTGVATNHYVTPAMQWGTEKEPEAISEFENKSGLMVQKAGFVLHRGIPFFGASPDGFIHLPGPDSFALLEVKCPTTKTFIEWKMAGAIPENHRAQMVAQLSCCGCREGVFVAFDPRIKEGKNMIVHNLVVEDAEILEIEEHAKTFLRQTEEIFERMTENG